MGKKDYTGNRRNNKNKLTARLLIAALIGYAAISYADDTEVYFNSDAVSTKPNVLFILDISGSMNTPTDNGATRLSNLKSALEVILTDRELAGLRIGTMSFASGTTLRKSIIDIDTIETSKNITKSPSTTSGYTILSQRVLLTRDNGFALASNISPVLVGTALSITLINANYRVGFRFDNILLKNPNTEGITPAVGIKKATFSFNTHTSSTAGNVTLVVDPAAQSRYLREDLAGDLHSRTTGYTAANSVVCSVPAGTFQKVSCDVTNLVRRQLGLNDWHNGNAISFIAIRNTNTIGMAFNTVALANHPTLEIEADNRLIADNEKTVATRLLEDALTLATTGSTYTVDAMLAASKYISNRPGNAGMGPYHFAPNTFAPNTSTASPITDNCQLTHLVLMSDGEPWGQSFGSAASTYMSGTNNQAIGCRVFTGADKSTSTADAAATTYEECGRALASWLARTSHSRDDANFVRTHTIGFNLPNVEARNFLNDVAESGMGRYYEAQNAADLIGAFQEIIETALSTSRPSASGTVVLGAENRYLQRIEVFYGLYKTSAHDYWSGNVKGFQLDYIDHTLDSGKDAKRPVLRAWDGNAAVVNGAGNFIGGFNSAWSTGDSGDVTRGGVVGQLRAPAAREIFTLKSPTGTIKSGISLISGSAGITTADLGLAGGEEARRRGLLDFIRGYTYINGGTTDPADALSPKIGESANNGIALVSYGCSEADKTLVTCSRHSLNLVGLQATNDGFFRGYDLESGDALYEFMPQQMLPVINNLQKARGLNSNIVKTYGLDGEVVVAHDDTNDNGIIDAGESAYAIVKAGRGGSFMYGFDISVANRNNPKLVWTINNTTTDFSNLGDTWSLPVAGKIDINGVAKQVLIMGGGYDKSNDTTATKHTNTIGNAIYVIDAATGAKLWSTSANMNYSVSGRVAVLTDKNTQFITDVFFGDMGGQIWHFKVNNGGSGSDLLTAAGGNNGIVASISGSTLSDTRRFYQAPTLYKITDTTVSINIGSGYKAHPLVTTNNDRFYSFRVPIDGSNTAVLTETDLLEADPKSVTPLFGLKDGFMIKLGNGTNAKGEKIITNAFADRGRLIFSSFIPNTGMVREQCVVNKVGTQRTYYFNIFNGASLLSTGYTEVHPSTLPLDPVVYCGAGSCTVITSMDMLADKDAPKIVDPSIFPQFEQGAIVKTSWTDTFTPIIEN